MPKKSPKKNSEKWSRRVCNCMEIFAGIVLLGVLLATGVTGISRILHAESDEWSDIIDSDEGFDYFSTDKDFNFEIDSDNKKSKLSKGQKSSKSKRNQNSDGPGLEGRVGHIAFPTFGRNDSLTHIELFPYIAVDDNLLFGDARLFMNNQEQLGGNIGVGFRHWSETWNRLYGASLWYDIDQTTGKSFNALGASLETYGEMWEMRSNVYFPVGSDEKDFENRLINPRFSGNQIQFDRFREFGEAMEGVDFEFGIPLPSNFADEHDVRVYGGLYYFIGDAVPTINGFKIRMEGSVTDDIATQLQFTSDDTFGSSLMFALAYEFSGGSGVNKSGSRGKSYLMRRFVERNYNVIVSNQVNIQTQLAAINPDTGQAYVVQHVSGSATGGSGSAGDPFASFSDAQSAGGDIILVQSGTVITTPVTLQTGDVVVGEGANYLVQTANFGEVALPSATGGSSLPTIQGVAGNAVTLASGSTLNGFVIDSPAGHGIVANGIEGSRIENVSISGAAGDGILMQNTTGTFDFVNVSVTNTTGTAFYVDGGSASSSFSGSINNGTGRAILVENTTAGTINFSGTSISDDGGNGILLSNADGNVTFGDLSVANSGTTGIDIQGGAGTFAFNGTTTITNATGTGINIDSMTGTTQFGTINVTGSTGNIGVSLTNSTGNTSFGQLNITTNGGTGLFVLNSGTASSTSGTILAVNASAVDIEGTQMDFDLTSVSSDGAVNGIRIVDSPGEFQVWGTGTLASGGVIQNSTVGVLVENSGNVGLQYLDLDSNTNGLLATNVEHITLVQSRVTNSTSYGFDLTNVKALDVWFSNFVDNGSGAIRAQVDSVDTYNYVIQQNVISDSSINPIAISTLAAGNNSNLNLTANGNVITTSAVGATAINLDWNGLVIGNIASNQITGSGSSNTGIDISASSTSALAQINASQNTFLFTDASSKGLVFDISGPSQLTVGSNQITFDGSDGVGMEFVLAQSANVNIFSNLIQDNVSAGTGIQFVSIDGPSNVTLNNNLVNLFSTDGSIDQGFIFTTVNGTISLSGTQNNIVNGASVPFLIPVGSSTGQFLINGVLVP